MGLESKLDGATGILWTTLTGSVGGAEISEHMTSLFDRDDLPRPFRELYDAREVGPFSLRPSEARDMVSQVHGQERFRGARFAVVAHKDLVYGMARLTELVSQALRAEFEFRAFRDLEQAETWLHDHVEFGAQEREQSPR